MIKRINKALAVLLAVSVIFTGSSTFFAGEPCSIEEGELVLNSYEYSYNGEEITPSFKLYVNDAAVSKKNLVVEYSNNVNVGKATITVTGQNKYCGTLTAEYEIVPLDISSSSIAKTIKTDVAGKKPVVTLTYKGKILDNKKDYSIKFANIDRAGVKIGKATISGKGNFGGSKTYSFNVYPLKVQSLSLVNRTTTSVEFKWKSQEKYNVSGYKVYSCESNGNNKKLLKTVSSNSVKITGLAEGRYSYYVVRAYKKGSDRILYGEYSKVYKTCTKPKKVELNCVANIEKSKSIQVEWGKVSCTGYELKYSTDKSFKKDVKIVTLIDSSSTSYKFKAKKDETYYVKVRAFRKYNGVTVYGKWSNRLSNNYSNLYASYSSNYVNNPDRTTNLRIASEAINGTILKPGETFSFNGVVGKRTSAKGYKRAHVFAGASSTVMGLGGGVCQVASTIFNATLLGNLSVVERHQHSQRVSYVPLGRDAAIYWGSEDYKFKNNTSYPIKMVMSVKDGKITCSLYTCQKVKPKKVSLDVTRRGNTFTLKRYVDGKCNYTTRSTY